MSSGIGAGLSNHCCLMGLDFDELSGMSLQLIQEMKWIKEMVWCVSRIKTVIDLAKFVTTFCI